MRQIPETGGHVLRWCGDTLDVTLHLDAPARGRAYFRTEIGGAAVARRETIELNELGRTRLEADWRDIPLAETAPGVWFVSIPLTETGVYRGKCCFVPEGGDGPVWPDGDNLCIKVCPAETRRRNAIYTVFPRQFGSFREVARRLDFILGEMGFDIIQTLPPFPVPVTYAVMGEYGCPFAATDFHAVDPAMAEFDERATPLDQFRELIGAVHARGGRFFIDLPANHTGWASALQTHHPEWFRHEPDGRFHSPGAWGVTWADLVELDYAHHDLRAYMADVFLFWARLGTDGFRCDAGYMIPADTWEYIVARVRDEYPDTAFMLEGLGGDIRVTDRLLAQAGLDWAYSEIFQTYDRAAFEHYLPGADARSRAFGTLVHFAETHDNDRLAKNGTTWARLRVALAALLSRQGAWGIANGVEWYATEKIDVHGRNDLNWGATENMVDWIAQLNRLIAANPDFAGDAPLELIERGGGNFLAVRRGQTLILANLDCAAGVTAHWDCTAFPAGDCTDALANAATTLGDSCELAPGAVRVFTRCRTVGQPAPDVGRATLDNRIWKFSNGRWTLANATSSTDDASADLHRVTWRYPADTHRDVPVPNGLPLEVVSAEPFRVRIQDGARTIAVRRGRPDGAGAFRALLALPSYAGDGTRANIREIAFTDYAPAGVRRTTSRIAILPPWRVARAQCSFSGRDIRERPGLETVLSDGAGAAARVKLAWGAIASQYDALLAANPNPSVPSDRLVLWTRCRIWLRNEGYVRELCRDCLESFHADPAGRSATWRFVVPCGLGRTAGIACRLELPLADATRGNRAVLHFARFVAGERDIETPVSLVLRPDLEWRSFHATTKAQGAVENAFARAVTPDADNAGFTFRPYGADCFTARISDGTYHHEPAWTYCVPHPEEAARGQDGAGDLFSPGWFSCAFPPAAAVTLEGAYHRPGEAPATLPAPDAHVTPDAPPATRPLAETLRAALNLFIVRRDDVKTVIAGYPWFLDWGRDTFIFLQGAIPAGFRREALEIVEAFARFEQDGTLPNIIYGDKAGNRDTVDAPLWFIRTLALLGSDGDRFRPVAESIVAHYIAGTPNGIRMDPDSALVWSPAHFTWMDTNYPACTPRCGYPVEIQALWIAALRYTGRTELAERAVASVRRFFATPEGYCDCLDAPQGQPAAAARPDASLRPNQLLLVTLDAVADPAIVRACERLLVPGGIRSLDAADAKYRGVYAGDEDTRRKPAYHNGTVWAWMMPFYAEAAFKCGLLAADEALSLLAGVVENLNGACVCQVSEIADGDAPHAPKGCRAQAWSASEFLRVAGLLAKTGA